jgi:hypothetical protein
MSSTFTPVSGTCLRSASHRIACRTKAISCADQTSPDAASAPIAIARLGHAMHHEIAGAALGIAQRAVRAVAGLWLGSRAAPIEARHAVYLDAKYSIFRLFGAALLHPTKFPLFESVGGQGCATTAIVDKLVAVISLWSGWLGGSLGRKLLAQGRVAGALSVSGRIGSSSLATLPM